MIKKSFIYEQNSAQLKVDGLPDHSLGQSEEMIGILSGWELKLVGAPILEGNRLHLQSLIIVVLSYSRYCLSGVYKQFGNSDGPVQILPCKLGHEIILTSSQEGVEPLKIQIDDAQLTDLVRCLDDLLHDNRVKINWKLPFYKPLNTTDLTINTPFLERFTPAISGITAIFVFCLLYIYTPQEVNLNNKENQTLHYQLK